MNVVWHWEITDLSLALPMDIKLQLKREIEHLEMKGQNGIDYMRDMMPGLDQFITPMAN